MLISNIVREVCVSVEHHKVEEHPVEEVWNATWCVPEGIVLHIWSLAPLTCATILGFFNIPAFEILSSHLQKRICE